MLIHLAVYYPESLYPLQIRNGIIKGLQIFAVLDLASLHKKIEINKKDRIHVCIVNNLKYVYFFLFLCVLYQRLRQRLVGLWCLFQGRYNLRELRDPTQSSYKPSQGPLIGFTVKKNHFGLVVGEITYRETDPYTSCYFYKRILILMQLF